MAKKSLVPTILVGLGGIGSSIVEDVYLRIPEDARKDHIVTHAFDTNVNDLSSLDLSENKITQTSKPVTVGRYLWELEEEGVDAKKWFPHEHRQLLSKTLTDGAGQVRAVSRLGYRGVMDDGGLSDFENSLKRAFKVSPVAWKRGVRVVIVTSLAGGTGAGIFLQTALYLRERLSQRFGKNSVIIRGAFVMPEVLTTTQVVTTGEYEQIRANGYACLKELDALIKLASDDSLDKSLELEYRPGMNSELDLAQSPYDFVFLYDDQNTEGDLLGGKGEFESYRQQVIQSLYLLLFSPMSGQRHSKEDNQIRNLIKGGGLNRYASSGVGRLIYPYDDVLEYNALRLASESVSQQWLEIDELLEEEVQDYENDLEQGVVRDRPRIEDRYVKIFESLATSNQKDPFFTPLWNDLHLKDERGKPAQPKYEAFFSALDAYIKETIEQDRDLKQAEVNCELQWEQLEDKDRARSLIRRQEKALDILEEEVKSAVYEHRTLIVNDVIKRDCNRPTQPQGEDYQLHTWMLQREEPLHPVVARSFLYQVEAELERRLERLSADNQKVQEHIRRYDSAYDLDRSDDIVDTPLSRLKVALEQPYYQRMFDNEFKRFVEEYEYKAAGQIHRLKQYKNGKLEELVYREVLEGVELLQDKWEDFFGNLRTAQQEARGKANRIAKKHDNTSDPSRLYVLASEEDKQQTWEDVGSDFLYERVGSTVSREIYLGLYRQFCSEMQADRSARRYRKQREQHAGNLFEKTILAWYRDTLDESESLDYNIIKAIRVEEEYRSRRENDSVANEDDLMKDRVRQADRVAKPMVPGLDAATADNKLHSWGLNPEVAGSKDEDSGEYVGGKLSNQLVREIFGGGEVVDNAFSRYEIIRYVSQYGAESAHLERFESGVSDRYGAAQGEYHRAYTDQIREMLRMRESEDEVGGVVTPHLDKRWHLPAYLPPLDSEEEKQQKRDNRRAFLYGLIYNSLAPVCPDQDWVWSLRSKFHASRPLKIEGEHVPAKFHLLHRALEHEPVVVKQILESAEKQRELDFSEYAKENTEHHHAFIEGCKGLDDDVRKAAKDYRLGGTVSFNNVLDPILLLPKALSGKAGIDLRDKLLKEFAQLTHEYYEAFYDQPNTAAKYASRFIDRLKEGSAAYDASHLENQHSEWDNLLAPPR